MLKEVDLNKVFVIDIETVPLYEFFEEMPLQMQAFFNQKIKSQVAGDDLVWNLSLLYNFSNTFARK